MVSNQSKDKKLIKYLGVDWGEKRVGLAIGDSESRVATPLEVVGSVDEVVKVVKDEEIGEVVVGAPLKMQNTELRMQNEYLEFIESLKKAIDAPVILIDERLSSKAADSLVGNKKEKAPRDAVAAMLILQTYLDTI